MMGRCSPPWRITSFVWPSNPADPFKIHFNGWCLTFWHSSARWLLAGCWFLCMECLPDRVPRVRDDEVHWFDFLRSQQVPIVLEKMRRAPKATSRVVSRSQWRMVGRFLPGAVGGSPASGRAWRGQRVRWETASIEGYGWEGTTQI